MFRENFSFGATSDLAVFFLDCLYKIVNGKLKLKWSKLKVYLALSKRHTALG